MDIKLFGAKEQKKLATYPERIMRTQKFQEAIPSIEELTIVRGDDVRDQMRYFLRELSAYKIAISAAAGYFEKIVDDATADCDKLEKLVMNAPHTITNERKFSLTTSIVQTKQQILFVEQQCKALRAQLKTINETEAAMRLAITQNNLANLAELCRQLKQQDEEIRNAPR